MCSSDLGYILEVFRPAMDVQGWGEEESVSRLEQRSALLEAACALGLQNCTQQALLLFNQYSAPNSTTRYCALPGGRVGIWRVGSGGWDL